MHTLNSLIKKYSLTPAWLAELCGFTRTQVSNWITNPQKYPIPERKKAVLLHNLKSLANDINKLDDGHTLSR